MIVLSLLLVVAAAVSLFIGLFVVTESLTFIFAAIGLCLVSLLLLWLGTRSRKAAGPSQPSEPVYGGVARAASTSVTRPTSSTPAASPAADEDDRAFEELDEATAPPAVVRKTTARDRAAGRVADGADGPPVFARPDEDEAQVEEVDEPPVAKKATRKAAAKKSTAKKSTAKKATKKAAAKKSTAKKATKKAAAKKSTAKKATKKAAAKKSTASRTTGADARAVLAGISGVGPAKQDALLAQYGDLESIRAASVDDIVANVSGFGEALASRVKDAL